MELWAVLMLPVLIGLLLLGYPVAFTLGAAAFGFSAVFLGLDFFGLLPLRIRRIVTNFTLIAVPLFGIDLLRFAVLIAVNLQTSFLTPPFGLSLFYLKAVAPPALSTTRIYRGIAPYVALQLSALLLLALFPALATWLPRVME